MHNGFKLDAQGYPVHTVNAPSEDADGAAIPPPSNADEVYPDDFDTLLAAMTAPADDRMRPQFDSSGAYALDVDPAVDAWRMQRQADAQAVLEYTGGNGNNGVNAP